MIIFFLFDILIKNEDWKFEERLSKEFESVGFFISDHPLNQFTEIFNDYKIIESTEYHQGQKIEKFYRIGDPFISYKR